MMKRTARLGTVEVTADGEGLVSHAGVALLVELADRVGLTGALSGALAGTRERCSAHDPGRVLRDVAVMLAGSGDCVTDMDAYRGQERLFGSRASETTTHRVLKSIDEQLLDRVRAARAAARAWVWDAGVPRLCGRQVLASAPRGRRPSPPSYRERPTRPATSKSAAFAWMRARQTVLCTLLPRTTRSSPARRRAYARSRLSPGSEGHVDVPWAIRRGLGFAEDQTFSSPGSSCITPRATRSATGPAPRIRDVVSSALSKVARSRCPVPIQP